LRAEQARTVQVARLFTAGVGNVLGYFFFHGKDLSRKQGPNRFLIHNRAELCETSVELSRPVLLDSRMTDAPGTDTRGVVGQVFSMHASRLRDRPCKIISKHYSAVLCCELVEGVGPNFDP
jgi:hypothetical protein